MWYPFFLEYCAHLEYLGSCYSSLKVSLCITSSGTPSLRTSVQGINLCFTALPLASRLGYFLSPLHHPILLISVPLSPNRILGTGWRNETAIFLPLQLLNQDSLDFSTCCLFSFDKEYLKLSLDFNLFALCVWGKQIQPNRSMLTSCQASLGQLQLCYWSSEADCTYGRHVGRRWRLEEAGCPSPSVPTYLSFWLHSSFFFFYCSGFCHTLKWNSHGFTCVPHPDPPSHFPLHPIPLGLPSAPGPSTCLMHPTWAGDLFHPR